MRSWLQSLDATEYQPILLSLFDKYVDKTMDHCHRNFKSVVPLPKINQVMTVCKILDGILPKALSPIFPLYVLKLTFAFTSASSHNICLGLVLMLWLVYA